MLTSIDRGIPNHFFSGALALLSSALYNYCLAQGVNQKWPTKPTSLETKILLYIHTEMDNLSIKISASSKEW